jgi:hypothetical protein
LQEISRKTFNIASDWMQKYSAQFFTKSLRNLLAEIARISLRKRAPLERIRA